MTTPTLTPERIAELTAELVGCAEPWPYRDRRVATLTCGEALALLASTGRLVEAERLLSEHNPLLCARFVDRKLNVPMPSPVDGCACLNCRTAAFLSPATATEETR